LRKEAQRPLDPLIEQNSRPDAVLRLLFHVPATGKDAFRFIRLRHHFQTLPRDLSGAPGEIGKADEDALREI
jgi:hypothetical protein